MRRVSGDIHLVFGCCIFCYIGEALRPMTKMRALKRMAHDQWWLKTWNILTSWNQSWRSEESRSDFFLSPLGDLFLFSNNPMCPARETEIWLATFIWGRESPGSLRWNVWRKRGAKFVVPRLQEFLAVLSAKCHLKNTVQHLNMWRAGQTARPRR